MSALAGVPPVRKRWAPWWSPVVDVTVSIYIFRWGSSTLQCSSAGSSLCSCQLGHDGTAMIDSTGPPHDQQRSNTGSTASGSDNRVKQSACCMANCHFFATSAYVSPHRRAKFWCRFGCCVNGTD